MNLPDQIGVRLLFVRSLNLDVSVSQQIGDLISLSYEVFKSVSEKLPSSSYLTNSMNLTFQIYVFIILSCIRFPNLSLQMCVPIILFYTTSLNLSPQICVLFILSYTRPLNLSPQICVLFILSYTRSLNLSLVCKSLSSSSYPIPGL